MTDNTFIYSIKGLLIPRWEDQEKVIEGINEYVEIVPGLCETLKLCLSKQKTGYFVQNMETVVSLLKSVCARWLLTDAEFILRAAKRDQLDTCRKRIAPFITDLLSLSIEMQIAQEHAARKADLKQSKIDTYTDIVNNITAIGKLVAEDEYDKAVKMLSDMDLDDKHAILLDKALALSEGDKAVELIKALREQYIALIIRLGGEKSGFEQTILVVDDRPEILATVGRMLKERYKVFCAPGGAAAIKVFVEHKPDLFVLDIDMPGMDGFTLAKTIRDFEEFAKTPIIFLTSNANSEYVMRAMQSGGNDFIVKPASRETLFAKAAKYLL